MKTELSDNDRQRIEQEAIIYTDGHGSTHKNWRGFLKGAEYATIYERDKRKLWNDENNNLIKELGRRDGRIQQLEAERSEVTNLLTRLVQSYDNSGFEKFEPWYTAKEYLDSLKTK